MLNKVVGLSIICLVIANKLVAQDKIKQFKLSSDVKKVETSLYKNIQFLDSREDTSSFGIVRVGTLNKEAAVKPASDMSAQLGTLLLALNPENAGNSELLFQLRRLKFVEKAEGNAEFGFCFFRANLYTPVNGVYKAVSAIDTFITVESGDVTNLILEKAEKAIVKFIASSLSKNTLNSREYTMDEIVTIDEIEKKNIKLYNVSEFTDGIYNSFESFKDQIPDYTLFSITFEDGEIKDLKARNMRGKIVKVRSDEVYAIVNHGKPYISAEFGYYPLVKNNNDFYFIGDDKQHFIKGQIVKSSSIFNPTEYIYSPVPLTAQYEIKIDHMNGKFMRVKEIK